MRAAYRAGGKRTGSKLHFKLTYYGCSLIYDGAVRRDLDDVGRAVLLAGSVIEGQHDVLRPGIT